AGKYGTAVPIALVAEEYKIDEPVLVFMGDDFVWNPNGESAAKSLINSIQNETDSAILGVEIPKEKVEKYGVLALFRLSLRARVFGRDARVWKRGE
ncbi:MAG: hypothetical protein IIX32_08115, partial [Alistipes sp.]|nr:hypothetical protein [Alistipes sp.]